MSQLHKDIDTAFAIASWSSIVVVAFMFLAGIV